jgi:hypothetical protein
MRVQALQRQNECRLNPSLASMLSNRIAGILRATSNFIKRMEVLFRLLGKRWEAQNLRAAEIEHLKYQDRLKHESRDPYRGFGRFHY